MVRAAMGDSDMADVQYRYTAAFPQRSAADDTR
jgi:hypothetical protein